ncbi:Annexin [Hexamita inflata]|uniref:Annexin n=1 Tax=Hexamita inflata TaxID=28002 RepID=A0AA86U352_9EUKA|nr:Annexin [Hexamita inflata]
MRGMQYPMVQSHPTDFMADAMSLRKAMKGLGTDEQTIFDIAASHNWQERFVINRHFAAVTGFKLSNKIAADFAGNAGILMSWSFSHRYRHWLECVGSPLTPKTMITAVILMSDYDLPQINETLRELGRPDFFTSYGNSFGESDYERLLTGWVNSFQRLTWDPVKAADELFEAAKGAGTNEDVFIRYLCNSTHESFAQICEAYQSKYKKTLRQTIIKEFSKFSEYAYLLAHDYMLNPMNALAYAINYSMKGAGTDDYTLMMLTVLFSDFFKGQAIVQAYLPFGDLKKDIKGDTKGKYQDALLKMWGLV